MRDFGGGLPQKLSGLALGQSGPPVWTDSPWRARTALGVDLNLLGAKNETGRPKAERAGASESRCRLANAASCEGAVLGSRWLDGQAREGSGRAIGTSRINVGLCIRNERDLAGFR